ncbi:hypothetical protein [Stutzerimonas kunmingensis]|uniref:hypothetical protein n=1 Tax=Stutzerimonas kunmingensis TaxID=1211807 RepID=UPI001CD130CB|nr:hypothetical protein [Stutzerimonas kunmingensis]
MLAAMAYVDLNPIHAGIAETPEDSDYTSIRERLADAKSAPAPGSSPAEAEPATALMPFDATSRAPWAIPFDFADYVELVECTGRAQHPTKKGRIDGRQPQILVRLGLNAEAFMAYSSRFLKAFGSAVGVPAQLVALCDRRQTKYLRGMQAARQVFGGEGVRRAG